MEMLVSPFDQNELKDLRVLARTGLITPTGFIRRGLMLLFGPYELAGQAIGTLDSMRLGALEAEVRRHFDAEPVDRSFRLTVD